MVKRGKSDDDGWDEDESEVKVSDEDESEVKIEYSRNKHPLERIPYDPADSVYESSKSEAEAIAEPIAKKKEYAAKERNLKALKESIKWVIGLCVVPLFIMHVIDHDVHIPQFYLSSFDLFFMMLGIAIACIKVLGAQHEKTIGERYAHQEYAQEINQFQKSELEAREKSEEIANKRKKREIFDKLTGTLDSVDSYEQGKKWLDREDLD